VSIDRTILYDVFRHEFGREPEFLSEAPGRVNLIGEHTDYNEGFVLPVAIDRTFAVTAAPHEGKRVRVYSADFDARDEWQVDAPRRTGRREWRDYVRGVAWALLDAGIELRGTDVAITGDVPLGAGLSSSAALEVAVAGGLCGVFGIEIEPQRLALLCQKAENQFVGVQCGIMDQLAAACSQAGHALLIDCRSLETEHVAVPGEVSIVVVDSKMPRRLSETAYNERREECAEAARMLGVGSLREVDAAELEAFRARLPNQLFRRVRHVVSENARVLAAVRAMRGADLGQVGHLMYESHESLHDDFEASTPELDLLVELALRTEGVIAARLTGAGFGGCTVNLVHPKAVHNLQTAVVDAYHERTGLGAEMHICLATGGLDVRAI
jgi:galactokinase